MFYLVVFDDDIKGRIGCVPDKILIPNTLVESLSFCSTLTHTMDAIDGTNKREHERIDIAKVSVENGGSSSPAKRTKMASEDKQEPNYANELPVHEVVGGSSVRQYLNKHLTQHVLEGLRDVSKDKPEDPLKYLGEFLIQRSNQIANVEIRDQNNNMNSNNNDEPKQNIENDTVVKSEQDN